MVLLIQSTWHEVQTYLPLFESYPDLKIEIIDFAFPQNFGVQSENLVEDWKTYQGLLYGMHGSYRDLLLHSIDPQIQEVSRKRYLWNLGIADRLNLKYTVFHSNYEPKYQSEIYIRRWVEDHDRFLRKVASQYQTAILFENVWEHSPTLFSLLQKYHKKPVSFCIDTSHLSHNSIIPIHEWFEELGKSVTLIHLKDSVSMGKEMALGEGNLKWDEIWQVLNKDRHDMVIETSGMKNIEKSLGFLEENGIV